MIKIKKTEFRLERNISNDKYNINDIITTKKIKNQDKHINNQQDLFSTYCGSPIYMSPEILNRKKYMDKQKALDTAIGQIEKIFGKGSIMKLGQRPAVDVDVISTGSIGLDMALGVGGLPRGRVIEIFGPESSGKTTLTLHVVAEAQKKGGNCAFIDAEHALDPAYAKN